MKQVDWFRVAILFLIGVIVWVLIQHFDQFQKSQLALDAPSQQLAEAQPPTADLNEAATVAETASANFDTEVLAGDIKETATPIVSTDTDRKLISVTTDVLRVMIDSRGGDIVFAELLDYKASKNKPQSVRLLRNEQGKLYIAQSGLIGASGTDKKQRPQYQYQRANYKMVASDKELQLDLRYQQADVSIIKRFTFKPNNYLFNISYLVDNKGSVPWAADLSAQIRRSDFEPSIDSGIGLAAFVGAAVTTPDDPYLRLDFEELEEPFKLKVEKGWVAMIERYFLSAWVPDASKPIKYSLRKSTHSDVYLLGYTQEGISLQPGEQGVISTDFYAGPKDQYQLQKISKNLDLTVDYGFLWWAAQPLYAILNFIYSGHLYMFGFDQQLFGGFQNWGLAIILLTVLVKLLFYQLSATSYKSMARMRKLQPQMQQLKDRYSEDRQKMSQETMKLYQKEKVNPLGGCLPILIQMPIFLALYWVLLESVELRHAPFFGWIQDLSSKDPLFILPLLMGASMYVQFKLNPTPPDPMQAKMMQFMPFVFTIMFLWFPSGLVLYWTVNNILSIAQQWAITRTVQRND